MSSSELRLEDFRIPLDEIKVATDNFSQKYVIGKGGFGLVYKVELSERFKSRTVAIKRFAAFAHSGYAGKNEFLNDLKLMCRFQHENIIPFIGYCDEDNEMITITKYASNGSLDNHLGNRRMRGNLPWAQRLMICIGVARGLAYLHSGLEGDNIVIHRDIKSQNVLLDENLEAQISDFSLSISVLKSQSKVYDPPAGTLFYIDPIYHESGILKAQADVYSFGVVLFELLTGMLAHETKRIGDDKPQQMIKLVRRYYDVGLDKLIDPFIRDQMVCRSLHAFEEMAYKCISFNTKDRPTMDKIIKTLEEALNFQNHENPSTTLLRTNQYKEHREFLIPLENIILATENFSSKYEIGDGTFTKVYKGEISERLAAFKRYSNEGKDKFFNELEMAFSFKHEKNIIPFIGYCYEGGEMIMIYEYAVNGSLDRHLQDPDRRRHVTWAERLKICIGVATAISYLHSGLGDELGKVIHGNIKSGKVLLNENLEATICGFGMSIVVPKDQTQVYELDSFDMGTQFYVDPIYQETCMLQTESDMYSFGMVLFEIVSGMLAYHKRSIRDEQPQNLSNLVRRYYDDGPENLIDPFIRDSIDDRSFRVFEEIAYKCISYNLKERPSMNRVIKRINEALEIQNQRDASTFTIRSLQSQKQDFRIPLEEIEKAIKEFGKRTIGSGAFGTVYKGKLSERWNNRIAAIKCLNLNGDEGKTEFDNELKLISNFHHENIIEFIGYCNNKGNDRILVFEYAVNGSLERHLEEPNKDRPITWAERLKICIGAARGLKYLHLDGKDKKKVIHRDVKSGNILLDEKFEAKICDFGLSKSGPDDQPYSKLFTRAAGTPYYIDPSYREGGILRTESDVYSFGVVMFELLTWIPAWEKRSIGDSDPQLLINLVRRYSLDKLVDPLIKDKSDSDSLRTFTDIAYKCIDLNLEKRPTMERIIDRLEDALELQENYLAKAGVKVINK